MPVMARPGLFTNQTFMYPNLLKTLMCSVVNKKVNKKLFYKEKEVPTLDVPRYKTEFHSEMKY